MSAPASVGASPLHPLGGETTLRLLQPRGCRAHAAASLSRAPRRTERSVGCLRKRWRRTGECRTVDTARSAYPDSPPSDEAIDSTALSTQRWLLSGGCRAGTTTSHIVLLRQSFKQRRKGMGAITTSDGTEIFYKDWGSGQPIVFSHGWPLSADDWDSPNAVLPRPRLSRASRTTAAATAVQPRRGRPRHGHLRRRPGRADRPPRSARTRSMSATRPAAARSCAISLATARAASPTRYSSAPSRRSWSRPRRTRRAADERVRRFRKSARRQPVALLSSDLAARSTASTVRARTVRRRSSRIGGGRG